MWSDEPTPGIQAFLASGGQPGNWVATLTGPQGSAVRLRPFKPGKRVEIGDEFQMPERFTFDARTKQGEVIRVWVVVADGRPRVTEVRVTEADGAGIRGLVLDRLALQSLVEVAAEAFTGRPADRLRIPADQWFGRRGEAAVNATRKRVTNLRLQEVADAYQRAGIPGIRDLGAGERHAYRLKRRAVDAGLLPPKGKP